MRPNPLGIKLERMAPRIVEPRVDLVTVLAAVCWVLLSALVAGLILLEVACG